jgi:hypothetical protein
MIKVPAEKLARAVEKHLLPGLLRYLAEQQRSQQQEKKSS